MGANSNELRVLDAGVVRPSDLDLPPRSIPLTFFDVKWLRPPPVQRLFLYRLHRNHDVDQLVSGLKASLSKALTLFYPLAGHVRLAPNSSNRYELFYQPGDGVLFTAAEYDADVDDLARPSDGEPVRVARLAPLVPPLPKGRAVLAVQATVLLQGRGLALGVTVHHSAGDGASSTHFLHTWAAVCNGAVEMPPPPVIDRTLIADPRGLYDIYSKGMPSDGSDIEFVTSRMSSVPDDQLVATFTLTHEVLTAIKDALAGEAATHGAPSRRCSSTLAAYSFIWSCYCRAKKEQNQTKTTHILFSVDHRARLKPPVPAKYFGNCCSPAIASARHGELAAAGTGGLFTAFTAIASALEEEVGEGSQERWDGGIERVKEAAKAGMVFVVGSPKFRVYDIDFGFGRPAKVVAMSATATGSMPVADARDGGGGVEVALSFPADSMQNFQRSFAEAMHAIGMQ
ncbi:hypothetical protein ACQJBY_034057 [Aegilops geniculata]